ncbi:MAG: flavin reductase family protein [Paracoccaceae bacterium]|nr:flavin reductase family protein [Paracoccaceae bacterium]
MFYRPEEGHGLPHNPFNAIVAPRPIGWIATRGPLGDNLAPYSFFNAVAYTPPQLMFASTGVKDSLRALRETGVFCVSIVTADLMQAMNATSAAAAPGVDEFVLAGLDKAECITIDCPRVAASPAAFECRVQQIILLKGDDNFMILGDVTGVHIADEAMTDGRFDTARVQPLARLGYMDYAVIDRAFTLERPKP